MIQLNQSEATNIVALYPDSTYNPANPTLLAVRFSGSQDYDRSGSEFLANVTSDSNVTPWVIAEFNGALLPDATGLYTYEIYEIAPGSSLIWNTTNTQWQLTNVLWNAGTAASKLVTTRAWVSGSDVPVFTQYESPDENGTYTTYLG
jgi:hypothetical protein